MESYIASAGITFPLAGQGASVAEAYGTSSGYLVIIDSSGIVYSVISPAAGTQASIDQAKIDISALLGIELSIAYDLMQNPMRLNVPKAEQSLRVTLNGRKISAGINAAQIFAGKNASMHCVNCSKSLK